MFEYNDKTYITVKAIDGCTGCAFRNDSVACGAALVFKDCFSPDAIWELTTEETVESIPEVQPIGTKYDGEKIQYSLIPPYALQEAARNLTVGLRKYKERNNWKKVPEAEQRYMDALYRHLEAVRRGELYDTESGAEKMPHMAAVVVNAMFLLEFMLDPQLKGE